MCKCHHMYLWQSSKHLKCLYNLDKKVDCDSPSILKYSCEIK